MNPSTLNNALITKNLKYANPKGIPRNIIKHKNSITGIQNALNILSDLERSLNKTSNYEKELIRCKASHPHRHHINEWWEREPSEENNVKNLHAATTNKSRSQVNLAESWSTMSIVCLQYQYEELSKRYEELLQAYAVRCGELNAKDSTISELQRRASDMEGKLIHAHKIVLSVGNKYLLLRHKRLAQKKWYEQRIESLSRAIGEVIAEAERTRLELDERENLRLK